MKKLITLLALLFAATTPQAGAKLIKVINTSTLEQVPDSTSIAPRRTVEFLEDGVRVTYNFDHIAIVTAKRPGVTFKFEDSERGFPFGFPDLPALYDRIEVPMNADYSLTLESVEFSELPIEVAPSYPLTNFIKPSRPDMPIQDKFVPDCDSVAKIQTENFLTLTTLHKICILKISPVSYNSGLKIARLINKLTYKLNFDSFLLEEQRSASRHQLSTVLNRQLMTLSKLWSNYSSTDRQYNGYLILTTSDLISTISPFVEWKKQLGYKTYVCAPSSWNNFQAERDSILKYWNQDKDLKYILVIGSRDKVPTQGMQTGSIIYVSDKNLRFEEDESKDFYVGRIPTSNPTNVKVALNKIMDYEKGGFKYNAATFNTSLHCAEFQDDILAKDRPIYDDGKPNDGLEDRDFI